MNSMQKKSLFFIFLFIFLVGFASSLGMSPAKKVLNFQPGKTIEIEYISFAISENTELFVSVYGYFAPYVTLSKNKLRGPDSFILTLNMPEEVDVPGPHRLIVQIEEAVDEELLTSTVGTTVTLRAALIIEVPYPGKYLDANLKTHNVNLGEPVNFEIYLKSHGDETINVRPLIEIKNEGGELTDTLILRDRILLSQEKIDLKKTLDTTGYNSGNYVANLIANYGSLVSTDAKEFRIGKLTIDILNYTELIEIGGYQGFYLDIESGWNDKIDGANAEIVLFENSSEKVRFKTSSTSLSPWERKTISGFFDTTPFAPGIYDGNVTVSYFGRDIGKSETKQIQIEFIRSLNVTLIVVIAVGILILLGILFFIIFKQRKKGKKNEKKK
jgi:hypothetical protein